jgi:peptidoglycan hydrolase-like protein with peptidoglycan-binding domain
MSKCLALFLLNIIFISNVSAAAFQFTQKSLNEIVPGKQNAEVKLLQEKLYDFGYYKSEEDEPVFSGRFDKGVQDALKDFQQTNELRVSGRADFTTLKTLNEFIKFQTQGESESASDSLTKSSKTKEVDLDNIFGVEEKNYFAETADAVDLYKTQAEPRPTSEPTSIITSLTNKIISFFKPSEIYRQEERKKVDGEEEKMNIEFKNKYGKYDFFECSQDDQCLKLLE